MSAPSSSSEKSSSIWSVINLIIGSVLGGAVLLWVLAFIFDGLGSLRPKAKAEAAAPAAPAAATPPPGDYSRRGRHLVLSAGPTASPLMAAGTNNIRAFFSREA